MSRKRAGNRSDSTGIKICCHDIIKVRLRIDVVESKSVRQLGYPVETFQAQLNAAKLSDTPERQTALKNYTSDVKGITAPAEDIQRRMNFMFGPVTEAARGLRTREATAIDEANQKNKRAPRKRSGSVQ